MAPPNLTRADARARGPRCSRSPTYTVALDLTDGGGAPGETTFATDHDRPLRLPRARRVELDRLRRRARCAPPRSTARRSTSSGYREDDGIALPDLAAENELVVVARSAAT